MLDIVVLHHTSYLTAQALLMCVHTHMQTHTHTHTQTSKQTNKGKKELFLSLFANVTAYNDAVITMVLLQKA
jgi:hypothetical protein